MEHKPKTHPNSFYKRQALKDFEQALIETGHTQAFARKHAKVLLRKKLSEATQ